MLTTKGLALLLFITVTSQCVLSFEAKLSRYHGVVASPNFTHSSYPNNYNDEIAIEVMEGHVVALYFDTFNVEEGGFTTGDFPCGDFVEVRLKNIVFLTATSHKIL